MYSDIGDWPEDVDNIIHEANEVLEHGHNNEEVDCCSTHVFPCFTIRHKLSRRAVKTKEVVIKYNPKVNGKYNPKVNYAYLLICMNYNKAEFLCD